MSHHACPRRRSSVGARSTPSRCSSSRRCSCRRVPTLLRPKAWHASCSSGSEASRGAWSGGLRAKDRPVGHRPWTGTPLETRPTLRIWRNVVGPTTPRPHGASPPWAKRRPQRKAKRAGAREATRCEHAPRCSAASSSVRRACLQEVESGESSTLWRPEARCGGHCRLSSGSGWTLGCVGAAVALGGIRWAEEEASPIRAEGPFNQLACCGEASCWWYVPCALPRATGSKSA